jgi:hypothetical protein
MEAIYLLYEFMKRAQDDPMLGPTHISLYTAILVNADSQHPFDPIPMYSKPLMKQAKIAASGTFYKCLKDLKEGAYIEYTSSYNPFLPSLFYLAGG